MALDHYIGEIIHFLEYIWPELQKNCYSSQEGTVSSLRMEGLGFSGPAKPAVSNSPSI